MLQVATIIKALIKAKSASEGLDKLTKRQQAALCNQRARVVASAFINEVKNQIMSDGYGLTKATPFKTQALGKADTPMYDTGDMLTHLKMKKVRTCNYVVYWDTRKTASGRNARTMINFHSAGGVKKLTGEKKRRWQAWFGKKLRLAGMKIKDVQHESGRPGTQKTTFLTFRPRPFWDIAKQRFISQYEGRGGISITDNYGTDKAVLITAE